MFTLSTKINHFTSVNFGIVGNIHVHHLVYSSAISICVAAEVCPPVPYIVHAHTPALQVHTGANTAITCDEGYLFDYGQQHQEIQCQDSREWTQQDEDTCTGRSTDVTQPHIE